MYVKRREAAKILGGKVAVLFRALTYSEQPLDSHQPQAEHQKSHTNHDRWTLDHFILTNNLSHPCVRNRHVIPRLHELGPPIANRLNPTIGVSPTLIGVSPALGRLLGIGKSVGFQRGVI